jgi:hypothetical protein
MDAIRSFLAPKGPPAAAATDNTAVRELNDQYKVQAEYLRDLHKTFRPKNTSKAYDPKQKEWEEWCAKLPGNSDGAWVTEDKLCLFLQQEVINRESRASGYEQRKAKRKEVWKESERAKKRAKAGKKGAAVKAEEVEEEEWDEEALDAQFRETIRYAQVNSYVSAITDMYVWQFDDKTSAPPPLRGAKLSTILESVRRDEDRTRRANFVDRGLFTIASGYDVKGLKRAISWCWEAASTNPGAAVESYLRTAAEHLLGSSTYVFLYLLARLLAYSLTTRLLRPCHRHPG